MINVFVSIVLVSLYGFVVYVNPFAWPFCMNGETQTLHRRQLPPTHPHMEGHDWLGKFGDGMPQETNLEIHSSIFV